MLIGPCALTMVGAATVAAAPAAATLRKRRRLEVVSLLDVVMVSPVLMPIPSEIARFLLSARQRPARGFGKNVQEDATLGRAPALTGVDNLPAGLFQHCRNLMPFSENRSRAK